MEYVKTENKGYLQCNKWEAWQYRKWMHQKGMGYVEHEHTQGFKTCCFKRLDMLVECGEDIFNGETLPRYREADV